MIVMNSKQLLEQLTELEERIQQMELVMMDLNVDCDREGLTELLIACQCKTGRQD